MKRDTKRPVEPGMRCVSLIAVEVVKHQTAERIVVNTRKDDNL